MADRISDEDLIEQYLLAETRLVTISNDSNRSVDFLINQFLVAIVLMKEIDSRGLEIPNVD